MTIKTFAFKDSFRGWTLNDASFSQFNLLVGISGVGKTRILQSLHEVRHAGINNLKRVNGCEWHIEIVAGDSIYRWNAKTSLVPRSPFHDLDNEEGDSETSAENPKIVAENIVKDGISEVVTRTVDSFLFEGKNLPKLKHTESAISLLKEEKSIAPLHKALVRFIYSETGERHQFFFPFAASLIDRTKKKCNTLESLREDTGTPLLVRACILQDSFPEEFAKIKKQFAEIFPAVTDVRIGKLSELDPSANEFRGIFTEEWLAIGLKERGVNDWIVNQRLSSGMFRTFMHIIELSLAPSGTVILIDELENSLGVNCLPQVTELLQYHSSDLQFIVTSHHPYVIENIPVSQWKLVTRTGSSITVHDSSSLPALNTASLQDKFTLLVNMKEYEEGLK